MITKQIDGKEFELFRNSLDPETGIVRKWWRETTPANGDAIIFLQLYLGYEFFDKATKKPQTNFVAKWYK